MDCRRDAGWSNPVEKGICNYGVVVRIPGCRRWTEEYSLRRRLRWEFLTGGKMDVWRRIKSVSISRAEAQNIHERDCCRGGRGGWDGKAKA